MLDAFREREREKNNKMVENEGGEKSNKLSGNIKGILLNPANHFSKENLVHKIIE